MATIADSTAEIHTMQGLVQHFVDKIKKTNPEPVLFNLGCGLKSVDGFKGVDFYAPTDVKADLFAKEWTFTPDGSVDMFYSSHFFEHVADQNTFMENVWRKLKDGGLFLNTTPYGFSPRAWQDPDHKRPIFRETYAYFSKADRQTMGVDHYEGGADLQILHWWPVWASKYAARVENNPDLTEDFLRIFGACDDLTVLLRKVSE